MATAPADAAPETKKKGKGKLVVALVALAVLLGGGAAAYFLVLAPTDAAAAEPAAEEVEPELGDVVTVDPISINLADGHYLKIGIALQQTAEAHSDVDGSKALDTVIELYSGKPLEELSDPAGRDALKAELVEAVRHDYHDEVVDVYFTQYVMQ